MRVNLTLKFDKGLDLPIDYNYIVQAALLKWLGDESYSKFIHDTGYQCAGRKYKMYTFSRLKGNFDFDRVKKRIRFDDNVNLIIASADDRFLSYLVNNVIKNDRVNLVNNIGTVESVECRKDEIGEDEIVETESPIVNYSTFDNGLGKKTYYYSPDEKEFSVFSRNNLIKKYNALYGRDPENSDFSIEPFQSSRIRQSVVLYKGFIIKGWRGRFHIKGSKELMNLAYNTGIGSKNSQGFGCIRLLKR